MSLDDVRDSFTQEVSKVFNAERQIFDNLPTLINEASDAELAKALVVCSQDADRQVGRLERVARYGGLELRDESNLSIQELIADGQELTKSLDKGAIRDAKLAEMLHQLKQFKIASYDNLLTLAKRASMPEGVLQIIEESISEECAADSLLRQSNG